MKRILIWFLAVLLLCPALCAFADEQEDTAVNYIRQCSLTANGAPESFSAVADKDVRTVLTVFPGKSAVLSWTDEQPIRVIGIEWKVLREGIVLSQYDADGNLLLEETAERQPDTLIRVQENTRSLEIRADDTEKIYIGTMHAYGEGTLPDPFHPWEETPEYLDYLLIATHPDDDVLWMGSIPPIYGAERGYVGTVAYVTHGNDRARMTEAKNCAWEMGVRYRPLFWELPDLYREKDDTRSRFTEEIVVRETERTYRQYHPLVVIAQDAGGEYGHWQHKRTSKAAVEAFTLAADPSYDAESAEIYGTWQVQKLYLHLHPENTLVLDAHAPLSAFQGDDALTVARRAYKKHLSQQDLAFQVRAEEPYPFNRFGMIAGVVDAGDDLFANVDETLLANYVPPTPSPEPTETPAPTAAATETPAPTAVPVPETPAPTDAPEAPAGKSPIIAIGLGIGIALMAIGAVAIAVILMRRRRAK